MIGGRDKEIPDFCGFFSRSLKILAGRRKLALRAQTEHNLPAMKQARCQVYEPAADVCPAAGLLPNFSAALL